MSSRNSRALVKYPSHALFSKEQNNRFVCKHPRRRLLSVKGSLALCPATRFQLSFTSSSRNIWGNVRLVSHRVSEKTNNNYFSINYVKEMPLSCLLPDLRKILGMIGKQNSGLCCLKMTTQWTKI